MKKYARWKSMRQRRRERTAAERNKVRPWGPHCFLWQGRHPEPFSKREAGRQRRVKRRERLEEKTMCDWEPLRA